MAKFEEKLQELGLQESQLSVACKNLITDYRLGIEQLPTLEEENEGGELDQDIETLQEELDMLDMAIVKKITWYDNNKEKIASGQLKSVGRPKKNPTATPTPTATATATPTATATATPTANPTPNGDPKPKKGFGFGTLLLVLGGAVLGVSLLNRK